MHNRDQQAPADATSVGTAPRDETLPHEQTPEQVDLENEDVERLREHPRKPEPFSGSEH
jgi:hypothetical protein